MTDEIRYLGDVQRLSLKPSDIIVIRSAEILTADACVRIQHEMKSVAPDNKVIVLSGGMTLEVLEEAA